MRRPPNGADGGRTGSRAFRLRLQGAARRIGRLGGGQRRRNTSTRQRLPTFGKTLAWKVPATDRWHEKRRDPVDAAFSNRRRRLRRSVGSEASGGLLHLSGVGEGLHQLIDESLEIVETVSRHEGFVDRDRLFAPDGAGGFQGFAHGRRTGKGAAL